MNDRRLTTRRGVLGAFSGATIAGLVAPRPAVAQQKGSAPSWHIGSFNWRGSVEGAAQVAERVLKEGNLKVADVRGWERAGSNEHVVVVVTCAPEAAHKVRIVVVATSSDFDTAAFWRSKIRSDIQRFEPNIDGAE
jgi:hypothetical protein